MIAYHVRRHFVLRYIMEFTIFSTHVRCSGVKLTTISIGIFEK